MARSTGPIIATGAITLANRVVFNGKPVDWRIVSATALTAVGMALVEKPLPELAIGLSWIALLTVTVSRVDPEVPAPAESFLKWWNGA